MSSESILLDSTARVAGSWFVSALCAHVFNMQFVELFACSFAHTPVT